MKTRVPLCTLGKYSTSDLCVSSVLGQDVNLTKPSPHLQHRDAGGSAMLHPQATMHLYLCTTHPLHVLQTTQGLCLPGTPDISRMLAALSMKLPLQDPGSSLAGENRGKCSNQSVSWEDETVLLPVRHEKVSNILERKFPKGRDCLSHALTSGWIRVGVRRSVFSDRQ